MIPEEKYREKSNMWRKVTGEESLLFPSSSPLTLFVMYYYTFISYFLPRSPSKDLPLIEILSLESPEKNRTRD